MENKQLIRGIFIGAVITIVAVMIIAMFTSGKQSITNTYPNQMPYNQQQPMYNQAPMNMQQPMYNQQPVYNQQPMYAQQPMHNQHPQQQIAFRPRLGQCAPGTQLVALTKATAQAARSSHQITSVGMEVGQLPSGEVIVTRVYQGSHADIGGVRSGDVIVSVTGTKTKNLNSFFAAIKAAEIELAATIGIVRDGRIQNLSVMVGQSEMDGVTLPTNPASPY